MESRTRVSSYLGLISWMYLHLRCDVLAVESRTRISFYLGLINWMYSHARVDIHSGNRTLQTSLPYLLSY
ncbi:unnamed protein product [Schistosoma mattheei]|uniref:Uncharacterized protein n=1 Tax=Schistosoma mattheei TaxID=31246 RepID=A0A3P8I7R9_9TREM|nr:unnamed protein product [Schistosoma mattheei]